jgi:hypothetical protein
MSKDIRRTISKHRRPGGITVLWAYDDVESFPEPGHPFPALPSAVRFLEGHHVTGVKEEGKGRTYLWERDEFEDVKVIDRLTSSVWVKSS